MNYMYRKYYLIFSEYWLGGRDDVIEGMWQWASTEQDFNFTNWAPDKPNNIINEDCVSIDNNESYRWNDQPCHRVHRYICERRYTETYISKTKGNIFESSLTKIFV